MSRFSYSHISVNSTFRDICYASMESCFQGLSFIYLHLRPLNNLWGLYDPKTKKHGRIFAYNGAISSHRIKCNAFIEISHWGLHFFFLHSWALSSFSGRYDQRTWKFYDKFHHFPIKHPPDIEHSRQWTLVCITVILIVKGLWRPVTDKYLESVWPLGCANTISFSGQVTMLHHV